jgi:hypothetical protein
MTNPRESLLAEWQAIGPSQPLTTEVQDLLLKFINTPQHDDVWMDYAAMDIVDTPFPPPQRFHRQRSCAHQGCKVPTGPSAAEYSSSLKNKSTEAGDVLDHFFQDPPSWAGPAGDGSLGK